jgi:hypothetical protein
VLPTAQTSVAYTAGDVIRLPAVEAAGRRLARVGSAYGDLASRAADAALGHQVQVVPVQRGGLHRGQHGRGQRAGRVRVESGRQARGERQIGRPPGRPVRRQQIVAGHGRPHQVSAGEFRHDPGLVNRMAGPIVTARRIDRLNGSPLISW